MNLQARGGIYARGRIADEKAEIETSRGGPPRVSQECDGWGGGSGDHSLGSVRRAASGTKTIIAVVAAIVFIFILFDVIFLRSGR